LKTIVDLPEEARPDHDRKHLIPEFHRIADFKTSSFFEDLQVRHATVNPDHFAEQLRAVGANAVTH
jgi:hypothetical protein